VLTTIAFGSFAPEELACWTVDALDPHMRLWLDCYGQAAIMAEFPGTKLYLLQPEFTAAATGELPTLKRHRLMPLHRAPRIVHGAGEDGLRSRVAGWSAQSRFVLFRLRFHVTEGWRYLIEAPRWKRILAASAQSRPALLTATDERGAV